MTDTTRGADQIKRLGAPAEICEAVSKLADDLTQAAGANLEALIIYGGLARGRYRAGKSDINLVVVLRDASAKSIAAIAPILRAAWRAVRVEPFIVQIADVPLLAKVFPTKVLDIQSHQVVIKGQDPFSGVKVSREQLRLRVEQGLSNLTLRLRRRYVSIFDDPRAMASALADAAVPFKVELAAMLRLAGKDEPSESTSAAVLEFAAITFDLDREALSLIAGLRRDASLPENLPAVYDRVLTTISRAAEIVSTME